MAFPRTAVALSASLLIALAAGRVHADMVVYDNDFQDTVGPAWSSSSTQPWGQQATPAPDTGARRFLGYFGDNDVATLTVDDIPAEATALRLEFDAYMMWSWDGNDTRLVNGVPRGPDVFGFRYGAGGTAATEQSWTFSLGSPGFGLQSYCDGSPVPCLPTTGAVERYSLGYRFEVLPAEEDLGSTQNAPMDAVYHFTWTVPHSGASATFGFFSQGLQVREDLSFRYLDEAWGLDNVRISAVVPEPASALLVGLGGLILLARTRRPLRKEW
ncbi:MAG: hypothetical protein U1F52_11265 [Burkholderiales bacterium]